LSLVDEKNIVGRRDSTTLLKMTSQIIQRRLVIDKDDEYINFAPITYIVTKRKVIKFYEYYFYFEFSSYSISLLTY